MPEKMVLGSASMGGYSKSLEQPPRTSFLPAGGASKNEHGGNLVERRERELQAVRVEPQSSTRQEGARPSNQRQTNAANLVSNKPIRHLGFRYRF